MSFSNTYHLRPFMTDKRERFAITCETRVFPAAARTSGVPGVPSRAQPEDDRGEEAGPVPGRGLQRSGGPESPQVPVRAPQGSG